MQTLNHCQNLIKSRIHLIKTWLGYLHILLDKSALTTWPWPYWLFFYGIIPLVLVIVPQVPLLLQYMGLSSSTSQDAFNLIFLLDFYRPTVSSMFLMNYTHTELLHLCGNLSVYIFVLEHNRSRLSLMSGYFLTLLPLLVSIVSILFFRGLIVHMVSFKGFSGIIMAYYGYAIYLIFSLFQTAIFEKVNDDWRNAGWKKKFWILYTVFIVSIGLVFVIFLSGIILGSFFTAGGTALGNGVAHFTGFMTGLLLPIGFGLVSTSRVKVLDIAIIFNIFFTIVLYSVYLVRIHG